MDFEERQTSADAPPARGDPRREWAARGGVALAPLLYFWPAARGSALLAPGDGLAYHFPLAVLCGRLIRAHEWPLWNPYLFGGFPLLAAIQSGAAYPGTLLFAVLPPVAAMNALVISTYALAAAFTFAYARAIGADRPGAAFSALTFAFGGFMLGHLGHTTIVRSAAFVPLLLWALERLRRMLRARFVAAGAVAIALQICGGHPQIAVYSLMLAGGYVAFFTIADPPERGRLRYVAGTVAMLALGLALAAVQLVPTAELSGESVRAQLPYDAFTGFSMPFGAVASFLFPQLLSEAGPVPLFRNQPSAWSPTAVGGVIGATVLVIVIVASRRLSRPTLARGAVLSAAAVAVLLLWRCLGPSDPSDGDVWGFHESSGYVGVATLVLAIGALPRLQSDRRLRFWYLAAGVAFLLALGGNTPLARVLYHVPVYNLFRAPARHLLELDFALAVIAGLAVSQPAAPRDRRSTSVAALAVAGCIGIVAIAALTKLPARALRSPALALPLAVGLPTALLAAASMRSGTPRHRTLLVAVQLVDLFLFARSDVWTRLPIAEEALRPMPVAGFLRSEQAALGDRRTALVASDLRIPAGLGMGAYDLPAYWELPTIQGYEQLLLTRYARFAGDMDSEGRMSIGRVVDSPQFLDLLGVKYVVVWKGEVAAPIVKSGIVFDQTVIEAVPRRDRPLRFVVPSPREATALALVSALSDSVDVADGTPVARVVVEGRGGEVIEAPVLAGVHSAEWAWDRSDVRTRVRHRKPQVAETVVGPAFHGHAYLGVVALGRRIDVEAVRIESLRPESPLTIRRLSLVDAERGRSEPLTAVHRMWAAAEDASRWREAWADDRATIFENLRVLPPAWMVSEVAAPGAEAALSAVASGKLADGRAFDPARTALVEDDARLDARAFERGGTVEIVARSPSALELVTRSPGPGFLVVSEIDYPGWKATVDGAAAKIVRTDAVLRGLAVPAGEHRVRFVFRPSSVRLGAAVSLSALLLTAGILWNDVRRNGWRNG